MSHYPPSEEDRAAEVIGRERAAELIRSGLDATGAMNVDCMEKSIAELKKTGGGSRRGTNWKALGLIFAIVALVFIVPLLFQARFFGLFDSLITAEITREEKTQAMAELAPYAQGTVVIRDNFWTLGNALGGQGAIDTPAEEQVMAALLVYALQEKYPYGLHSLCDTTLWQMEKALARRMENARAAQSVVSKALSNRSWGRSQLSSRGDDCV